MRALLRNYINRIIRNCIKNGEERKIFFATLFISYFIGIIIALCVCFFNKNGSDLYQFGNLKDISFELYVSCNICGMLAPTAITFNGTILVLNRDKKEIIVSTILFIIIVAICSCTIGFFLCKEMGIVRCCAYIIVFLSIIAILCSWRLQGEKLQDKEHKMESSDGRMVT